MFELIKVTDKTYVINSPAKIGIVLLSENEVVLIDSGNDKEAGRKVRQICDEHKWKIKAILNTHSNADHIGGNKYLINQTGCMAFSNPIERLFTHYPYLESSFLYGAYPPSDLRHKFLCADASESTDFTHPDFPQAIEIIDLPGHFFQMVGFKTQDNVVFLADSLASIDILDKYALFFIYDVKAYLESLVKIEKIEANYYIPSHADICTDIKPLVQYNRDKVHEIIQVIINFCLEPIIFEHLLQKIFDHYQLKLNFEQYVLVGSTVRSYCAYLKDQQLLDVIFKDNLLMWKKR